MPIRQLESICSPEFASGLYWLRPHEAELKIRSMFAPAARHDVLLINHLSRSGVTTSRTRPQGWSFDSENAPDDGANVSLEYRVIDVRRLRKGVWFVRLLRKEFDVERN